MKKNVKEGDCKRCGGAIDEEDTVSLSEEGAEHSNCPVCLDCGAVVGSARYPVPDKGYSSLAYRCGPCHLKKGQHAKKSA